MDFKQKSLSFIKKREKSIQKEVVAYIRIKNIITIDCDSMFALSYIHNLNNKIIFCSEKKAKGWTKGQPDLIVISPEGKVYFLELKTESNKQSTEQKFFQEELEKRSCKYYVIRSVEDLQKNIDF